MSDIILQTDRLQVRPLTEGDFDNLLDLHSDPEVNRYLSCGPVPMSAEEVRTRLDRYLLTNKTDVLANGKSKPAKANFLGEQDLIGRTTRQGGSWDILSNKQPGAKVMQQRSPVA